MNRPSLHMQTLKILQPRMQQCDMHKPLAIPQYTPAALTSAPKAYHDTIQQAPGISNVGWAC